MNQTTHVAQNLKQQTRWAALGTGFRNFWVLGPAAGDHRAALRVGVSVALPVLLLMALSRHELIVYAVFGAFVGMYGRQEPHQLRIIHQSQAAVLLVGGASIGIVLSALQVPIWTLILVEAIVAGSGSLFADRFGLKPAGSFFCIFALGACASVPLQIHWWVAVLICAGSALIAMLVGFSVWADNRGWKRGASRTRSPFTAPAMLTHALRYTLAVGLAGTLAYLLGIGHPYWAMAAAAVPLAAETLGARLHRGVHRMVGTTVGVGLTALILLPDPVAWVLSLTVVILQFPTELFMTRHYALAMVFFTPLILIMTHLAAPSDPGTMMIDRTVETIIGAIIGMAIAVSIREPRMAKLSTQQRSAVA